MDNALFEIKDLRCSYDRPFIKGKSRIVLEIKNLLLPRGKKVFIVGESGIGKSTVLEVLGMMNNTIVPDPEAIFVFSPLEGEPVDLIELWNKDSDEDLSAFRLKHFNFIFQNTNLMRNFTAFENIAITRMLQGYSREESFIKAEKVLKDLGLGFLEKDRLTQELSGGQQQRLAFARAILPEFTVLFGDEPTGNLDAENAMKAMELLSHKLDDEEGCSAIIVSHDMHLAVTFADIVIKVKKHVSTSSDWDEDSHSYGVIDSTSVFVPNDDRTVWSNGQTDFQTDDFEAFLRKKV